MPVDQRRDQRFGPAPVTRNCKAQRITAGNLVIRALAQGHRIPALRPTIVAHQIISQRAVYRHSKGISPRPLGLIKDAHRLDRVFGKQMGPAHQHFRARIAGLQFLGPLQKPDGGVTIAQLQRCFRSLK